MPPHHLPLPGPRAELAPDGSEVRVLVDSPRGGLAHFTFSAGTTSSAVRHRTVDELWFVVSGRGRMWTGGDPDGFPVEPGTSVALPPGTPFQVRVDADADLVVVGATMPPWPGPDEAAVVEGPWDPT